ncbi:MAG: LpxI family protein [Alphaproteobacteria bacterium]
MDERIGILAGDGNLPKILINKIKNPFVVGISGFFNESNINCDYITTTLENFGVILKSFRDNGVEKVILAGGVGKLDINKFTPQDNETKELISILISKSGGEDMILRTVIEFINSNGFKVIGVEDVIGEQSIPQGILTNKQPTDEELSDIEIGREELKQQSQADIGQAIAVSNGNVIASEDENGTDALINKVGGMSVVKSILVKGKKENQTRLADLPVIGVSTIENLSKNNFSGIAIYGEGTIIIDKESVIEKANKADLFIVVI